MQSWRPGQHREGRAKSVRGVLHRCLCNAPLLAPPNNSCQGAAATQPIGTQASRPPMRYHACKGKPEKICSATGRGAPSMPAQHATKRTAHTAQSARRQAGRHILAWQAGRGPVCPAPMPSYQGSHPASVFPVGLQPCGRSWNSRQMTARSMLTGAQAATGPKGEQPLAAWAATGAIALAAHCHNPPCCVTSNTPAHTPGVPCPLPCSHQALLYGAV
jgi:hypothetical protein